MKEKSIWVDTIEMPSFPKLDKNINIDVLIIGGGITGILCAYELKKRNINAVIVEKRKIGQGITKNATAFITAQHETLYQDIIKEYGASKAKSYLDLNLKAVEKFKELAKIYDIDYEECSSTFFSSTSKEKLKLEKEALDLLGYKYEEINKLPLDIPIVGGISFPNQGVLHPLKLIKELSKNLKIYEDSEVIKLRKNYAYTKNNKIITFKNVIITTHFPFINRTGFYFTKMYQRRSYVLAIKYPHFNGTYCNIDGEDLYFRSYKDYLIIGGNDRDTKEEHKIEFKDKIKDLIKNKNIEYIWSNQDCVTLDGIPYIGRYDSVHSSWYVATGFNLWGISWAMASSFILADLIENKIDNLLVEPKRSVIKKKLIKNLGTTTKNLITFKTPRCTHLGCALHYNEIDEVYECPCHGSRFTKEGELINGPARKNLD